MSWQGNAGEWRVTAQSGFVGKNITQGQGEDKWCQRVSRWAGALKSAAALAWIDMQLTCFPFSLWRGSCVASTFARRGTIPFPAARPALCAGLRLSAEHRFGLC